MENLYNLNVEAVLARTAEIPIHFKRKKSCLHIQKYKCCECEKCFMSSQKYNISMQQPETMLSLILLSQEQKDANYEEAYLLTGTKLFLFFTS